MMKRILLLGYHTSLGGVFAKTALHLGHDVWGVAEVKDIPTPFPPFCDWIVNCLGRNQLEWIGDNSIPHKDILVDNVVPIYELMSLLIEQRHPAARVLSVASQTYRIPQTNTAMYCASKAALVQLTRAMARELAPKGWVINAIAPGKIEDTRMAMLTDEQVSHLRGWKKAEADGYALRNIPMRRFTTCAEVSEAMLKILELPAYINGTCIDMTGGA